MSSDELRQIYDQYFLYVVAGGVLVGLIFGSVPLILGSRRGRKKLGLAGLILSALSGAFSPLLSAVIAAVFTFIVIRKPGLPGTHQEPAD